MRNALTVILIAVTIDAIGIGLIFPILPSLIADVAHSPHIATIYGVLLALYALMQFIFSPVLGILSDRYGRRPVLLVSLAGAAVDYLIMAFAPALWFLFIGRAIAGITSANFAVATAYLADITPEAERPRRFGYLHACFGIGFILGPAIGGALGDNWIRAPFLAAALLNAVNFSLALFVLPESRPGQPTPFRLAALNPFGSISWAMGIAALMPLMALYFLFNLIGQVYGTTWALYGADAFGWNTLMIGLSLAGFGVFHAGAQAVLTGPVSTRLGPRLSLVAGMACETAGLILLAFATQGWMVFVLLPLFALGGIGMPALQSVLTATVDADKQGQLQGVLASILSLASIVGPLVFSWFYFWSAPHWAGAIWLFAAAIYIATLPLILKTPRVYAASPQTAH
ncbi:MAG TPA: Tet(A)/Tet(B)/Tet(C) family tetracycline efflux MFS transporter [Bauldia sp.]|nr:Tet(A)/Tet(B)/Tet(C) family tetracycline efflux MFS transporter [Bauldia sp.]